MQSLIGLCLLTLASVGRSQDNRPTDPNQYFIYPPLPGPQWSNDPSVFATNSNITYGVQLSQPFKWKTNTTVVITLFQEGNPDSVKSKPLTGCTTSDYVYWDGKLSPIDIKNGSVFFLGALNCTVSGSSYVITSKSPAFFSHYFNLTLSPDAVTSTSSSAPTSTAPTVANTAAQSSTGTAAPTPTILSSGGNSNSNSGSNAVAIGAGIGGGLGGALALVGIAFLFFRYRNKQKEREHMHRYGGYAPPPNNGVSEYYNHDNKHDLPTHPQELPARSIGKMPSPRYEAP